MSHVALGGTELARNRIFASLPADILDTVQIIAPARLEGVQLLDKPRILWFQDLAEDPAVQHLANPASVANFQAFIFVSNWQREQYLNRFPYLPVHQCHVIKNAIEPIDYVEKSKEGKFKFYYASTPHRGLAVLSHAIKLLGQQRDDFTVDVFSSFKIYGRDEMDVQFKPLYDQLYATPQVNYHGSVSNDRIRQAAQESHALAYPSIYVETSCLTVIEAAAAGCLLLTTNLGALSETASEWAWYLPSIGIRNTQSPKHLEWLAHMTAGAMAQAIDNFWHDGVQNQLRAQRNFFRHFYSHSGRLPQWLGAIEVARGEYERRKAQAQ